MFISDFFITRHVVAPVGWPAIRSWRTTLFDGPPSLLLRISEEWWGEKDLNLRRRTPTELQSVPFGHLGISPHIQMLDVKKQKSETLKPIILLLSSVLCCLSLELEKGLEPPTG